MTTVRALIAIVVKKHWNIYLLDMNNIFLHREPHEEVYIEAPQGVNIDIEGLICKLNKSLYRLKQASRQWYASCLMHSIQGDILIP